MKIRGSSPSFLQFAGFGAILAFTMALLYGLLYALIGIIYTSGILLKSAQMDVLPTVAANAVSVVIGALFFAILFGLFAAGIQGAAFGLVHILSTKLNAGRSVSRGGWIGFGISLAFSVLIHVLVLTAPPIVYQVFWKLSYLLWLGFPCLIFISLTTFFARRYPLGIS
jgi:hypothetical protein